MHYLYILQVEEPHGLFYKVGMAKNIQERFSSIRRSIGGDCRLLTYFRFPTSRHARFYEKNVHVAFQENATPAKIGIGNGHTEWFAFSPEELKMLIYSMTLVEMSVAAEDGKLLSRDSELMDLWRITYNRMQEPYAKKAYEEIIRQEEDEDDDEDGEDEDENSEIAA